MSLLNMSQRQTNLLTSSGTCFRGEQHRGLEQPVGMDRVWKAAAGLAADGCTVTGSRRSWKNVTSPTKPNLQ